MKRILSTLPVAELARRAGDARIDGDISKETGMTTLVAEVGKILGV